MAEAANVNDVFYRVLTIGMESDPNLVKPQPVEGVQTLVSNLKKADYSPYLNDGFFQVRDHDDANPLNDEWGLNLNLDEYSQGNEQSYAKIAEFRRFAQNFRNKYIFCDDLPQKCGLLGPLQHSSVYEVFDDIENLFSRYEQDYLKKVADHSPITVVLGLQSFNFLKQIAEEIWPSNQSVVKGTVNPEGLVTVSISLPIISDTENSHQFLARSFEKFAPLMARTDWTASVNNFLEWLKYSSGHLKDNYSYYVFSSADPSAAKIAKLDTEGVLYNSTQAKFELRLPLTERSTQNIIKLLEKIFTSEKIDSSGDVFNYLRNIYKVVTNSKKFHDHYHQLRTKAVFSFELPLNGPIGNMLETLSNSMPVKSRDNPAELVPLITKSDKLDPDGNSIYLVTIFPEHLDVNNTAGSQLLNLFTNNFLELMHTSAGSMAATNLQNLNYYLRDPDSEPPLLLLSPISPSLKEKIQQLDPEELCIVFIGSLTNPQLGFKYQKSEADTRNPNSFTNKTIGKVLDLFNEEYKTTDKYRDEIDQDVNNFMINMNMLYRLAQ